MENFENNLQHKICVVTFHEEGDLNSAQENARILLAEEERTPVRIAIRLELYSIKEVHTKMKELSGRLPDCVVRAYGSQKEYYAIMADFLREFDAKGADELNRLAGITADKKTEALDEIAQAFKILGGEEFRERNCVCGLQGLCSYCKMHKAVTICQEFVKAAEIVPPRTAQKDLSYMQVSDVIGGLRKRVVNDVLPNCFDPEAVKKTILDHFMEASKTLLNRKEG